MRRNLFHICIKEIARKQKDHRDHSKHFASFVTPKDKRSCLCDFRARGNAIPSSVYIHACSPIRKIRVRDKQGIRASSEREFSAGRTISNFPLDLAPAGAPGTALRIAPKIKMDIPRYGHRVRFARS